MKVSNESPLVSLSEYKQIKKWSNRRVAEYFGGFSIPAIQKMLANSEREILVWNDQLVEIKEHEVLATYCDSSDLNWPHDHKVILIKKLEPKKKNGK